MTAIRGYSRARKSTAWRGKRLRRIPGAGLLALAVVAAICPAAHAQALTPYAYVSDAGAESVSVIDTSSNTVVDTAAVGITPQTVASTPTGNQVYVANSLEGTVSVLDTATDTTAATLSVPFPSGIAFAPDGSLAYISAQITSEVGPAVKVIDTATHGSVAAVPVGVCPNDVAIAPDGSRVYVVNVCDETVSVIDTASNTVIATIPVGENPWGIAVSPSGGTVYVANGGGESLSLIGTATDSVEETVPLPEPPDYLAVTPDGSTIYATATGSNEVMAIDTASNTVVGTIPVGEEPQELAMTPDGSSLYVANQGSDSVSVIDTATQTVVDTIPVLDQPIGVAVTPPIEGPAIEEESSQESGSTAAPQSPQAPPSTASTVPAAPRHSARPAVAGGTAWVHGGRILLSLHCASELPCKGIAKLMARQHKAKRARHRLRRRARMILIGKGLFSIPAGQRSTARIRLTAKGKTLMRRSGKHGLIVRLSGKGLTPRTLHLKQARHRRHHKRGAPGYKPGRYVGVTSQTCPADADKQICTPGKKIPISFTVRGHRVRNIRTTVVARCNQGVPAVLHVAHFSTPTAIGQTKHRPATFFGRQTLEKWNTDVATDEIIGRITGRAAFGVVGSLLFNIDQEGEPAPDGKAFCRSARVRWRVTRTS